MLHTPIRYINNGEPLDQVTLNRYMHDTQQNLEELFAQVFGSDAPSGSVTEAPNTLALRDEFGTTQFTAPRVGTNPLRLDDATTQPVPSTVVMRDANGNINLGSPSGVESAMRVNEFIGSCTIFAMNPGSDWVRCDGRAVSRTTYAALFDRIGTTYGNGNGSSTFNVPDLRDLLKVFSGSTSTSTFGPYSSDISKNGTAPADGLIIGWGRTNYACEARVNGLIVQSTTRRNQHVADRQSFSFAVAQGDSYTTSNMDTLHFFPIRVPTPPTPSTISIPVHYYIRAR